MRYRAVSSVGNSLILTASLVGWVGGAPPESDDRRELRATVVQLLERLDSNTRQQRVAAQQQLLELGPRVLPLLPATESLRTAGVRESVRRIRLRLERIKAARSVESSVVTLSGRQTLAAAARQIAEQTGNSIEYEIAPDAVERQFAFDLREQKFWPAVDALNRQASLRYAEQQPADRLILEHLADSRQTPQDQVAAVYSQAFRLSVRSAQRRQLFGDADHDLLRVRLSVLAEPRLRPLFVKYAGDDLKARAAMGTRLEPLSPQARQELPLGSGGGPILIQADFKVPAAIDLTMVELRGLLSVQTAAAAESFEFSDLPDSTNVSRRNGGVTVVLRTAEFQQQRTDSRQARLRVSISYDTGGPAFESHRNWVLHNRAVLQTSDGSLIRPTLPTTTLLQTDGAVLVEYTFEQLAAKPEDYVFVYSAPTLIVNVPLEFEFPRIPIPSHAIERTPP